MRQLLRAIQQIDLYDEYSLACHEYLKRIGDNIDDDNIVRTVGESMNYVGGYIALRGSYYTLSHIIRPLLTNNHEKYIQSWYDMESSL